MAGSALLRSAVSKMARAPRRLLLQEGLQHHSRRRLLGPEPSNRLSSYSTSTNHRGGQQMHNKKVSTEWDWAKAAAIDVAPKAACFMALSTSMFIYFWVNPALDRMKDSLDAINIEISRIEDGFKHTDDGNRGLLDYKENHIEARDLVGQAGQGKETGGQ